ncbi:conserved hypothetical protein [Ricinus communis]|uniref:Uncharacterized protein n=1 Tax=Ricinus communis TaxID=3988 RepID=B9RX90_RICCO|nr:conserved hypothetical protein [Ricinus communis]
MPITKQNKSNLLLLFPSMSKSTVDMFSVAQSIKGSKTTHRSRAADAQQFAQ